ncbi:peptidoglycan bridge formation glycyltransferase FemA/FemB family protein [Nocardioides ganghwensis]|uniref:Peptidoglycan bridge formation glycyltransferase FemA/FemB family protein n=1 Tax=Nocardioides ganghwensis TaxID=252230 RepID=A0A4Q2SB75_9ACTN|nr:peptidoglycan bridge formation glycyltransferase FemA/FemB family protein [Nocardioides ganghwensis]RYB98341.1 peptidoglycan bridge formation glycyltransferase FemA/FemB family protein [Nocardioides ganghwensis]
MTLRPISAPEHREFIAGRSSASFLQTPAWASVKADWKPESIGWFRDGDLVGVGLVLYRQLPKVRRYLAYLPEGPVIEWAGDDLEEWLAPMVAHLKREGAFAVRMGPPVVTRRWSAAQVKAGIADESVRRLGDVPPHERSQEGACVIAQLHELGWQQQTGEGGFTAGQPQFNFQVPLVDEAGEPRTEADVLAGMNQLWRRNIKKADKAGVEVSLGERADLKAFHDLYVHTAERDHFTPRPLSYFETMYDALAAEDPDRIQLWLARHEGDLVAATIAIRVGTHAWYSYGASSTEKREVRGSNAVQWAMIRHALAGGAHVYDLRGITETLDADDPHVGLIQFKVGTGGEAVEYAGEWDLPINRAIYKAFQVYLARRG